MNYLKLSILAIATVLFSACSSNDDVAETSKLENGGSVRVNIALPQVSSTRAAGDPDRLDDGDANEYNVKSADIALYATVSGVITCVGEQHFTAAQLQFEKQGTSTDNITSASAVVKVPANATTPEFALAIVNDCEGCSVPTIGQAYSEFVKSAKAPKVGISDDGYFMMTNSVYAVTESGASKLKNLQPINAQSISRNPNVLPSASTTIYVERVNAKVQVKMDLASEKTYATTYTNDATTGMPTITFKNGDELVIDGWDLTVTNTVYYPVKQISQANVTDWSDASKYQMHAMWNAESDYRSYWAVDPNYAKADYTDYRGMLSQFNYKSYNDIKSAASVTKYCLENTFDVTDQNKNQTTAVILRGTYKLKGETKAVNIYTIQSTAYNEANAKEYIASRLNAAGYQYAGASIDGTKIKITNNQSTNVLSYAYDGDLTKNGTTVTIADAISATFGSKSAIKFYPNGECFYTVQIKNFGDAVQLYNADGTYYSYNGLTGGINTSDKLGRYGVVRNTWYIVTINSISGLGSPVPEDPTQPINPDPKYPNPTDPKNPDDPTDPNNPTPDDTENYYIAAQIKILPWAVRTQGADL